MHGGATNSAGGALHRFVSGKKPRQWQIISKLIYTKFQSTSPLTLAPTPGTPPPTPPPPPTPRGQSSRSPRRPACGCRGRSTCGSPCPSSRRAAAPAREGTHVGERAVSARSLHRSRHTSKSPITRDQPGHGSSSDSVTYRWSKPSKSPKMSTAPKPRLCWSRWT